MKKIKVANFRCKIEFQTPTRVQDGTTYAYTTNWLSTGSTWAKIEVDGGVVFDRGDNTEPQNTHKITFRHTNQYYPGRTTRIKYGNRYFKINSIEDIDAGNKTYTQCKVEEIEADY